MINDGSSWICEIFQVFFLLTVFISAVHGLHDNDEPYPSLSDVHDYEPNLEFDDSELHQPPDAETGKNNSF